MSKQWVRGRFVGTYQASGSADGRPLPEGARRYVWELQSGMVHDPQLVDAPDDESNPPNDASNGAGPRQRPPLRARRLSYLKFPPAPGEREWRPGTLYDVRLSKWRLSHGVERHGRAYGRVTGELVGKLSAPPPSDPALLPRRGPYLVSQPGEDDRDAKNAEVAEEADPSPRTTDAAPAENGNDRAMLAEGDDHSDMGDEPGRVLSRADGHSASAAATGREGARPKGGPVPATDASAAPESRLPSLRKALMVAVMLLVVAGAALWKAWRVTHSRPATGTVTAPEPGPRVGADGRWPRRPPGEQPRPAGP